LERKNVSRGGDKKYININIYGVMESFLSQKDRSRKDTADVLRMAKAYIP